MKKRKDIAFKVFRNKLYDYYLINKELLQHNHLSEELWLPIFIWYFESQPESLDDPRWHTLLHKIGGMQANLRVREIILRLQRKTLKKAA